MVDEGVLFEGLRLGSRRAFEELIQADDPAMRRVSRLYVPEDQVAALVRQTWSVALPGLDMFVWHTTLRAWLTGILVTSGRARRSPGRAVPAARAATRSRTRTDVTTTLPWGSLGWSSLWEPDSWGALEDALFALPLPEREVLWLHDVEGWSWREVLDTLGLTGERGTHLLRSGRSALAGTVASLVGADPTPADDGQERAEGVAHLLAGLRPVDAGGAVEAQLLRTFTDWRRRRGVRTWLRCRWELDRRLRAAGDRALT